MAAKDCLDMMVLVPDLATTAAETNLSAAGYRRRPEPWNNVEPADDIDWPKMVFAPPVGSRRVNVHVRTTGTPTARLALLFRDYLRRHRAQAHDWASLKVAAAATTADLAAYGQIKAPAWRILMQLAEQWADRTSWQPDAGDGPAAASL
jgi:dephospho-CoA kinase